MKVTNNFNISEFESKDGSIMPKNVLENIFKLAKELQILRDYTDLPITINSGYRSEEHNKLIGGSPRSQHVLGKAADIVIKGMTPKETCALIEFLIDNEILNIKGLGNYDTFTHIDIRNEKARW
tara:strand:+ start:1791 stop:2162 length:372 start_codon:yes stop_codon:yes gene_type:complete